MDFSTLISETKENVFPFVFISLFVSFGVCIYLHCGKPITKIETSIKKYLPELIKRRSMPHKKYMSRVGDSNFDQKKFPKNYEQIRAWL